MEKIDRSLIQLVTFIEEGVDLDIIEDFIEEKLRPEIISAINNS